MTPAPTGWLTAEELDRMLARYETLSDTQPRKLVKCDLEALVEMARAALALQAERQEAVEEERNRVLAILDGGRPYWMAYREIREPGSYPPGSWVGSRPEALLTPEPRHE